MTRTDFVGALCLYVNGHARFVYQKEQSIFIHPFNYANGITSHYSGQPRTVTSSYKYAAPKKDEKANPF